jgi:hypothetical protein
MSKGFSFYKKPFITGIVFLILSIACAGFGTWVINSQEYPDGGYALWVFGFLFLVTAVVILAVYGALERKFKKTLENPLLFYYLEPGQYRQVANKNAEELQASNKALLIIMLFFCAILVLMGLFIEDDGYILSFIGIVIAVFLTIAKIIITRYRTNKIKNGSRLVVLSKNGAYVCGEFHCWNTPATSLKSINYKEKSQKENHLAGFIEIAYLAAALPTSTTYKCNIPVPIEYRENAITAISSFN